MEVHAHTHTPRKKWTHYFWEFLMLFLAVFCGFLAENQREHMVEHRREKQFMQSMIEDLNIDTAVIQQNLRTIDVVKLKIDTMLLFIKLNPDIKAINNDFIKLNTTALPWLQFSLTDRTSSQLKNAGNMRLLRNIEIANQLILYWEKGNNTINSQQRYEIYRLKCREMLFKTFRIFDYYLSDRQLVEEPASLPVFKSGTTELYEYANYMSACGAVLGGHISNLVSLKKMAIELLSLIKEKYHLK